MLQTAIILAGGFGTRLQTVVNDVPKPMAPIDGIPFLTFQLTYLKHFGFKKVILSVGYLSEKIKNHYQISFEGMEIEYVTESIPLGTGGGIRLAIESCQENLALVLNGDSFFDIDLNRFYNLHQQNHSQISLALRKVPDASRYGTIQTNSKHQLISFKEKNTVAEVGIINGGVYILDKNLFLLNTSPLTTFSIEKDFFEKQLTKLNIKGFEFNGYFIDIGIPEDYAKAQNDFKEFKYR